MNSNLGNQKSLNVKGLGKVSYQKLGDLNAEELNAALTDKTIPISPTTSVSTYTYFNENSVATEFNPKSSGATNGVSFYRLIYRTRIPENRKQYTVSGLLAVPDLKNKQQLPLLSWQHGTILDPIDAPSNLIKDDRIQRSPAGVPRSAETLFNVVRMAGNGYTLAAADYIGNGVSQTTQAYAVKGATQQTTADMLTATKAVLQRLDATPGPLFLNGWSQGGLNTQWLSERLQQQRLGVERQAVVSGPSDLQATVSYWINDYPGEPPWLTSTLPLVLGSYEQYYGIKNLMRDAIKPEYLETSKKIYNKEINWDEVTGPQQPGEGLAGLPAKPKDMLTGAFIEEFNNGKGAFYNQLGRNTALTVKYNSPSRFYGGGADTIVPEHFSMELPVRYQKSLGSSLATGDDMGPGATHRSTFLSSLFGTSAHPSDNTLQWFNAA